DPGGNFFLPDFSACQKQTGDIRTGNKKHKAHADHQDQYCWPYIHNHLLAKRDEINTKTESSAVIGGILLLNTGEYCFHLAVRLSKTDFRFKASDKIQIMVAEVRTIRCNGQWPPQVYVTARKPKARGHNSY